LNLAGAVGIPASSDLASNPVASAPAPRLILRKNFLLVGFIL
jgi:hypothetical protein